jgi:nucleotide-binding universal stress UspA family protein
MKARPAKKPGRVSLELSRKDEALLERATVTSSPFAIQRILVPVDFSECSQKALDYAVPFARQFGASLILLHVVPANYPVGEFGMIDVAFMEKELRASGEKQLARLISQRVPAEAKPTALVRVGRPVTEIVQVARQENADLIILSTHGHTGFKHVLLGSVAENVVRYANCPVLVVREHEHEFLKNVTS